MNDKEVNAYGVIGKVRSNFIYLMYDNDCEIVSFKTRITVFQDFLQSVLDQPQMYRVTDWEPIRKHFGLTRQIVEFFLVENV